MNLTKVSYWTAEDERKRIEKKEKRLRELQEKARLGPIQAAKRVEDEKYKLWFNLQTDAWKIEFERRRLAVIKSGKNRRFRQKHFRWALLHQWPLADFTVYIEGAVSEYLLYILEMKSAVDHSHGAKPLHEVFIQHQLNDVETLLSDAICRKVLSRYQAPILEDPGRLKHRTKNSPQVLVKGADTPSPKQQPPLKPVTTEMKSAVVKFLARAFAAALSTVYTDLTSLPADRPSLGIDLCRGLVTAEREAQAEVEHLVNTGKMLIISPEQLLFKQLNAQAHHMDQNKAPFVKHCRSAARIVSSEIVTLDRDWTKLLLYLSFFAIASKHRKGAADRAMGEALAAARVTALFRMIRVRKTYRKILSLADKRYIEIYKGEDPRPTFTPGQTYVFTQPEVPRQRFPSLRLHSHAHAVGVQVSFNLASPDGVACSLWVRRDLLKHSFPSLPQNPCMASSSSSTSSSSPYSPSSTTTSSSSLASGFALTSSSPPKQKKIHLLLCSASSSSVFSSSDLATRGYELLRTTETFISANSRLMEGAVSGLSPHTFFHVSLSVDPSLEPFFQSCGVNEKSIQTKAAPPGLLQLCTSVQPPPPSLQLPPITSPSFIAGSMVEEEQVMRGVYFAVGERSVKTASFSVACTWRRERSDCSTSTYYELERRLSLCSTSSPVEAMCSSGWVPVKGGDAKEKGGRKGGGSEEKLHACEFAELLSLPCQLQPAEIFLSHIYDYIRSHLIEIITGGRAGRGGREGTEEEGLYVMEGVNVSVQYRCRAVNSKGKGKYVEGVQAPLSGLRVKVEASMRTREGGATLQRKVLAHLFNDDRIPSPSPTALQRQEEEEGRDPTIKGLQLSSDLLLSKRVQEDQRDEEIIS